MRNLLRTALRDERGIALVIALMTMTVLTIAGTSAVYYAQSNQHQSNFSKANDTAYRLAETGLTNASAQLAGTNVNALVSTTLQGSEAAAASQSYSSGTAKWWGTLNSTTKVWTIRGVGVVTNPDPNSSSVIRRVSAQVAVTYTYSQPLNAQAWNYVYMTNTGGPNVCDVTLQNNMQLDAPLYIDGNLCFTNNTSIREDLASPTIPINVVVKGKVQWANNGSSIGVSSTNKVTSVYVAGGCGSSLASVHVCKAYPTSGYDPIYANTFSTTTPTVSAPVVDWVNDGWYGNASPGPNHACATVSGTPPAFDGGSSPYNTQQNLTAPYANGSIASTVDLTPAASYTCKTGAGELSWNASTHTMTVAGVLYIDGNVSIGDGSIDDYNGQATLWISGYATITGSLCGKRNAGGTACDNTNWNPNTEMLIVAAHGTNASGYSFVFPNNATWEGGLYAAGIIDLSNNVVVEGPMIGGSAILNQNVVVKPFPVITSLPTGAPGNPNVYAQPNTPGSYTG